MEEAHSGVCGAHQSGPKLHLCIDRMDYYWPAMVKYCIDYARRCQACQFHANLIHQPPEPLHPTVASWTLDAWGLDVVGPMIKSFKGHLYILAATDYFSKWAKVVPLKEVKKESVADFIRTHIIYRYGVPRYIITGNGKPIDNGRPMFTMHQTGNNFLPKWDGPYVVKEAYTNGAYKFIAEDGLRIGSINGKFLKRYYA
ncbi:UNVERIFIED_CONTAM: hypothetical protein Sradi_4895100 [Sesamum radiatum]|uniref:Integrase catalytic domain-containing protein n=1 Tax=Sesamum radiatum TaxID=300843 RepID=A0AAW2MC53_SESRA